MGNNTGFGQNAKNPTQDLSIIDKKLIYLLSGELGPSSRPYADLAQKLGISEDECLLSIKSLKERGLIRRFGAILVHQKSGFSANAMIVWQINEDLIDQTGEKLATLHYVSHCYHRRPVPDWPFNLYTMIHAENREKLFEMVRDMALLANTEKYKVLESTKELKKDSIRYFSPPEPKP